MDKNAQYLRYYNWNSIGLLFLKMYLLYPNAMKYNEQHPRDGHYLFLGEGLYRFISSFIG